LKNYGVRGVAHNLISSYLSNRKEFVSLNQTFSSLKNIRYGVPQGPSLGPQLFLIYINDLTNTFNSQPTLFADDACLIVQANTPETRIKKTECLVLCQQINDPAKSQALILSP